MEKCLIVAVSDNGAIGVAGDMPWHIGEDLKYFKKVTMGCPVIMGRKTYESIGRPLPGRDNIVITGRPEAFEGLPVRCAASLSEAFDAAAGAGRVFVIGGARVYADAVDIVDRMYITRVHTVVADADAFHAAVGRKLVKSVREYKRAAVVTPLLVLGEVVFEVMIPLYTADLIDAILEERRRDAFLIYADLLKSGYEEVGLLSLLANQLRFLEMVGYLDAKGLEAEQIAPLVSDGRPVKPARVRYSVSKWRRLDSSCVEKAMESLYSNTPNEPPRCCLNQQQCPLAALPLALSKHDRQRRPLC